MKILQKLFREPLETEFERAKFNHEYRIVKNKMVDYYRTIEPDEVNLSGVYYKSPEQRAFEDILNILRTDVNKFHSLYEKAYNELI